MKYGSICLAKKPENFKAEINLSSSGGFTRSIVCYWPREAWLI
jgi:hypothetical protein